MTNPQPHPRKPSAKQLRYLTDLALASGQSFTYPQCASEASREITRLKRCAKSPQGERRREERELRSDMAARSGGASAVRSAEIEGYGSSASWR